MRPEASANAQTGTASTDMADMAEPVRQVAPLRATPVLAAAAILQVVSAAMVLTNATAERIPPGLLWLTTTMSCAVGAWGNWRTGAVAGLDAPLRRFWRQLGLTCVIATVSLADNTRRAFADPGFDGKATDLLSVALAALTGLMLFWTLLSVPADRSGDRSRFLRLALDASIVGITVAVCARYLTLDGGAAAGLDAVPTLIMSGMGLIGALAFMKVSMSRLAALDRTTVQLLATGAVVGGGGIVLFTMLVGGANGLNGSHVSIPPAILLAVLAADRQRRGAGAPAATDTRRRPSLVPYLAVLLAGAVLVQVAYRTGGPVFSVALAVVCLTITVVVRQIWSLMENDQLLRRVDAGQQLLAHRANHDALTGLANRALFEQHTREALAGPQRDSLSLALIDLDDFKAINDRLGHAVGDALLVVVAERLSDCVRADDLVARLGGDEFGLVLHGLREAEATDVLTRITEALRRPVQALGYDLLVSASAGLAEAWAGAGPQELLRRADLAMYAAKGSGKGRHAVYDARLEQHQAADAELGAALRRALDNGEFSLVYQPIVRLPDGAWTGLETLIRWQRPDRGFVGPDTFIPIAERTGLIVPLGDWILRTALRQAAEWDVLFTTDAPREIGINVSARQLREPGFAKDVKDALAETGFDPERVVVEVTETAVFDGGVAVDTLQDLVGLGVKVALDDFGTGHSSLGLLRTCPADTLKVDKSFVDGIGRASEEAVIATAMIQITDGLHLQAVAEGVETAEQAEKLYRMGYRFAQGYHFSRPLTPQQVHEQLSARHAASVAVPAAGGFGV